MGQIANQMAFETFYKVKEKIKETRAEKSRKKTKIRENK